MPGMSVPDSQLPPGYAQWAAQYNTKPAGTGQGMAGLSYADWAAQQHAAPTSDTGAPAAAAPSGGGGGGSAAQPTMPSGGEDIQTPAVQALSSIANPEKLQQQINPEGWGIEAPPQLSVPGERNLPPSSRALATLAAQRGRVY